MYDIIVNALKYLTTIFFYPALENALKYLLSIYVGVFRFILDFLQWMLEYLNYYFYIIFDYAVELFILVLSGLTLPWTLLPSPDTLPIPEYLAYILHETGFLVALLTYMNGFLAVASVKSVTNILKGFFGLNSSDALTSSIGST